MEIQKLKYNIIQKITELDSVKSLEKVREYIESLHPTSMDKFALQNNKNAEFNHRENFTDYIKEWVKEM